MVGSRWGIKEGWTIRGPHRDFEADEAVLYPDDGRGYASLYLPM